MAADNSVEPIVGGKRHRKLRARAMQCIRAFRKTLPADWKFDREEANSRMVRTFPNVWDALEDTPEDAATMTMRSNVMIAIKDEVRSWNITQAEAARRLGVTQPRLNDLLHGKINKFSLDTLVTLAQRAGLKVKVDIRSAA